MPIISAVGLFCCDKFEETPNEKVVNMSNLTKSYFKLCCKMGFPPITAHVVYESSLYMEFQNNEYGFSEIYFISILI